MPHLNLKTGKPFCTGAKRTPAHKIASSPQYRAKPVVKARPIVVPSFLEMWLNDQDGDCVTAEEAAAIAMYSVMCGLVEIKITDATVMAFCNAYDFLNGANLTDVMDKMISNGFVQDSGYKDGAYASVDYSNETVLQAAIEEGPVKIGIDSTALPSGAGNANGWYASGGTPQQYQNEDHCVGIWNYGPSSALFQALGVPMPSGFPATGYHIYTWSTVGVVDHAWLMSTVGEAWVRNPTTVGVSPTPGPGPQPSGLGQLTVTETLSPGTYSLVSASGVAYGTIAATQSVPPGVYPIQAIAPTPPLGGAATLAVPSTLATGPYAIPGVGAFVVNTPLSPDVTYTLQVSSTKAIPPTLLAILKMVCAMLPAGK